MVLTIIFLITDIRRWQSYIEPGDEVDTGSPTKRISRNLSELHNDIDPDELLPLAEGTLSRNLGKVYKVVRFFKVIRFCKVWKSRFDIINLSELHNDIDPYELLPFGEGTLIINNVVSRRWAFGPIPIKLWINEDQCLQ